MLLKKMFRDMRQNLSQFIAIFLMSMLGVTVFAGINAEWQGMKHERDRFYEESRLPDFWLLGRNFTEEDLEEAAQISGVEAVSRRLIADAVVQTGKKPALRIHIIEDNELSRPHLVEGEAFDPARDGIWLDSYFAEAHDIRVGDTIRAEAGGMVFEKEVIGLIMHPEYVYCARDETQLFPQPENFGFAFVPKKVLPEILPLPYNQLMIRLEDSADAKVVQSELEKRFKGKYSLLQTHETHLSTSMIEMEIQQNKAIGNVFPVVFFLIAALAMLTTMVRMTGNQRIQIGTLKAMGYSRHKILFHYISYGIWIGLAGGLLGLAIGPLLVPPILFEMQKTLYYLPDWYAVLTPESCAVVIIAVLCCGASSYFACRRELKDVPAACMRPKPPRAGRHTRWEKSALWHKLGFSAQWNIRDILRSKVRSAMAIAGVAGSMTLLLCAFGVLDTIGGLGDWMYRDLHAYDYRINLKEEIHQEEIDALKQKYGGQLIQEHAIELRKDGREETGFLTVIEPGEQIRFQDPERNPMTLPDSGAAMTCKMATLLGLEVGETFEWRNPGDTQWHITRVEALYRSPTGQGITMSERAYEAAYDTMVPTALLVAGNGSDAVGLPGVKDVKSKDEMRAGLEKMLESMRTLVGILILAAVVLGAVVLYNLGSMSFAERVRELATLKVLGFFPGQIRGLLNKQNLLLTIVGIIIGMPCGYALIAYMVSTLSEAIDMPARVSPATLVLCIIGTLATSLAVGLLLSRKVGTIDMVSSLKAVE